MCSLGEEQLEHNGQCVWERQGGAAASQDSRGVQGVRESQGRRARQGAGCTERTCTVRFVEGLIVDAGIAEGVGVTVATASSHCAGRY